MIDYIKAARRLRRLLASLKDQDPELSRIADILERLGLRNKPDHPVKQVFREAGKILRELDVTPSLETFFQELIGESPQDSQLKKTLAKIEEMRHEHHASLIILKATQNERNELKRQLGVAQQECDAWMKAHQAVAADSNLPASDNALKQLVLRYCASVVDAGSLSAQERLDLFQQLLKAAQGE